MIADFAPAQAVFFLGQHGDGAAFRSFVSQGGELGGFGQILNLDARSGNEFGGLAVAQGDGAGFVEQKDIHVARGFHGASAGGQDIAAHEAVYAGNADGAQQTADGGWNQTNDQRQQHGNGGQHHAFCPAWASL